MPEPFLNKVAGLRHRCFLVNFAKFLRTTFLQNTSGRLLLSNLKIYLTEIKLTKLKTDHILAE